MYKPFLIFHKHLVKTIKPEHFMYTAQVYATRDISISGHGSEILEVTYKYLQSVIYFSLLFNVGSQGLSLMNLLVSQFTPANISKYILCHCVYFVYQI